MKYINLTKDEFTKKLDKFLEDNDYSYTKNETIISDSNWNCDITIAGNRTFKYAIYDTKKGLTVVPQGQNLTLAETILTTITSDIPPVEHKSQPLDGIIPTVYDKIKEYYQSQEEYIISETICSSSQINLSILKNKQKVIIQYYPTTHSAILKGQSTYLWNDVFFELTSHLNIKAKEIVKIYLKSKEEMQSLSITYDEGILEEYVKCLLGDEVYSNENLITEFEKQWIKTSAFLVYTEIQLPEYFASIASAVKIIEGVLSRICIDYHLPQSTNFDYFEPNEQNTVWHLKQEYKENFKNDKKIIQTVNDLYNFIHNNRHKLFHDDGINPELITEKNKAVAIFQRIITLLKQVNENSVI